MSEPIQMHKHEPWPRVDFGPIHRGERKAEPPIILCRSDGQALFYRNLVTWVSGPPENGKSFLTQVLIAETIMAGGHAFLIDYEDMAEGVDEKLQALGASPTAIEKFFHYYQPEGAMDGVRIQKILADAAASHPVVTVIDGVGAAMGASDLDQNKSGDFYKWWGWLGAKLKVLTNGPTIVIDHVIKSPATRGVYAIGTSAKLDATFVHFGLEMTHPFGRGLTGKASIWLLKDRAGWLRGIAGKWTADHQSLLATLHIKSEKTGEISYAIEPPTAGEGVFRPTHLMERVSKHLAFVGMAMSKNAISKAVAGRKEFVLKAVDILLDEHFITVERKAGYAAYRHAEPYTEDGDAMAQPSIGPLFIQATGSMVVPDGSAVVPGTNLGDLVPDPHPKGWVRREPVDQQEFPDSGSGNEYQAYMASLDDAFSGDVEDDGLGKR